MARLPWKSIASRLSILLGLVLLDLVSKALASEAEVVLENRGGIWGIFPGPFWPFVMLVVLGGVVVTWLRSTRLRELLGWTLILAGGAGNLIDRLYLGWVRDFVCYPILDVCGNVADIYLLLGTVLLVFIPFLTSNKLK